jgi:hypothetical protein
LADEVWISLTSLGGVVVGGLLSYLIQARTQRSAELAEQRRERTALAETRRAERIARLERFVEVAARAERCAFTRPTVDLHTDQEWLTGTQAAMDSLWVAERMIRLQFPQRVHEAARAYFLDLNRVVWQGLESGDVRDYLEHNRAAFLDAARAEIS